MRVRGLDADDLDVFVDTAQTAFGRLPGPTGDGRGQWWSALETDRALLARADDGRPVGTAADYPFELTLPGGAPVPVAGVTAVGVLPSHRRQGVLSAMMRYELGRVRERGEMLAVLLASEGQIYGRFGFGPATWTSQVTVARHRSALTVPRGPGSIEVRHREGSDKILEEVYDHYRRTQPGALSRPHRWWSRQAGRPPIAPTPRYLAVHRDPDGTPDGYASYQREDETLTVDEIVAADDVVYTDLARFALEHDLADGTVIKHVPRDHPLRWQFADPRAGGVSGQSDWLWVRLLDVPRALEARGWLSDGDLTIEVNDPFLNEHPRHHLTVREGRASCVPTDRTPDLTLDVRDLGSLYLGGVTPTTLTRAGRIRPHTPEAVARADSLFRVDRAPHCVHWF